MFAFIAVIVVVAAAQPDAESLAFQAIRAFTAQRGGVPSMNDADRRQYRSMLRDFIALPKHAHDELLGSAYAQLLRLDIDDPKSDAGELAEATRGVDGHDGGNFPLLATAVESLADRGVELSYSEGLARRLIPGMQAYLNENRADYGSDFDRNAKAFNAQMHDALGWVLVREGKRREGKKELDVAYGLDAEDPHVLYHLGRFADADGKVPDARRWYARGAVVRSSRTNPNLEALRRVYSKEHGSERGFDSFVAGLREKDTRQRRERVLAGRLSPPRAVHPFRLQTLAGAEVSSDSLRGKVVVINFWGLWCAWCLREMPDFAAFQHRYGSNPDVRVLTIDTADDPAAVRRWMNEKHYDFPVLLDANYAKAAGVRTYPTTWFLDRNGNMAFEKIGFNYDLVNEFSWRVEALTGH